ncbi:ribonuclease H2 subunit C isoform X2 [Rhodamnia argentea]|uniref:Ribonuclease H2 subunit C isoform X2 n=1 Tax=Rhodamnia argentea TaxID=178133 RepID=A0A8B8ML75_9MYRT|nr:ribonuclease H2 subunit C isoform X2 [Rhodamnia argentea]
MDCSPIGSTGTIDLTEPEPEPEVDLSGGAHLLPCTIKYDGPCSVSQYFKPRPTGMEADGLAVQEAYFRGRKLQGAAVPLPPGYSGFVIGKKTIGETSGSEISEGNLNFWEMKAKFGSVTYWNHDCLPSQDDAFLRSFHWISVAEALHKPVTAEDLATSSVQEKTQIAEN